LPSGDTTRGAWRAVLERAVSDGFRENRFLGRDDTNGRDETTARLKFRLESEHGWRADLALLHADFDNGYDAFAIDNSFTTLSDRPGKDSQRSDGASLDLAHAALGTASCGRSGLGGIGHRRQFRRRLGQRARLGRGWSDFFSERGQAKDSFRRSALVERGGRRRRVDRGAVAAAPRGGKPHCDDGLYLADAFVRELGSRTARRAPRSMGRRTCRHAGDDGHRGPPRRGARYPLRRQRRRRLRPARRVVGRRALHHARIVENQSLWATLARGYRAGGFNIGTSVPADRQQFASEYLWSAEAGWRGADAEGDRRADVNLDTCAASTRRSRPRCSSIPRTPSLSCT
jgi:hypothetical protein